MMIYPHEFHRHNSCATLLNPIIDRQSTLCYINLEMEHMEHHHWQTLGNSRKKHGEFDSAMFHFYLGVIHWI